MPSKLRAVRPLLLDLNQGADSERRGSYSVFTDCRVSAVINILPLLANTSAGSPPLWVAAQNSSPGYDYGPGMMWGWGWAAMIFGPLFMILFLAAGVAIIVLLVRLLGGSSHWAPPYHSPPGRTPLDILKERYARGEIDKGEFEERRRVLGE
jgi:putative membrane protein